MPPFCLDLCNIFIFMIWVIILEIWFLLFVKPDGKQSKRIDIIFSIAQSVYLRIILLMLYYCHSWLTLCQVFFSHLKVTCSEYRCRAWGHGEIDLLLYLALWPHGRYWGWNPEPFEHPGYHACCNPRHDPPFCSRLANTESNSEVNSLS